MSDFHMAVLMIGETAHPCCVGCSHILAQRGLFRFLGKSMTRNNVRTGFYRVADGHTLDECRRSVLNEHKQTGGMSILDFWGVVNG